MSVNAKIYDLRDNEFLKKEQSSKIFRKRANKMRINSFLKNENRKKYEHSDILTHIYLIYIYQSIFKNSRNKLILTNVLWYLYLYLIL